VDPSGNQDTLVAVAVGLAAASAIGVAVYAAYSSSGNIYSKAQLSGELAQFHAQRLADSALTAITTNPSLVERYFGRPVNQAVSQIRQHVLTNHFQNIREYLGHSIQYGFTPFSPVCAVEHSVAYTTNEPDFIFLCDPFFKYDLDGIPDPSSHGYSQSHVIIHEIAHLAIHAADVKEDFCGGTCYGETNVIKLAENDPNAAESNADNYAYFAERADMGDEID